MIKIPLQKACDLLDEAWYVSEACGKDHQFTHSSYGCAGEADATFLALYQDNARMAFVEKDNQEVEISEHEMVLVNDAGARMHLVLFSEPNWLERTWADALLPDTR